MTTKVVYRVWHAGDLMEETSNKAFAEDEAGRYYNECSNYYDNECEEVSIQAVEIDIVSGAEWDVTCEVL